MLGIVLAAASAIMQGAGAIAGASAQNKAKKANAAAANAAFSDESHALAMRLDQEAQANAQAVYELSRTTAADRSSLAANAAASGVAGNSVDALDAEMLNRDFQARDVLARNFAMTEQSISMARQQAETTRKSRINGVQGADPLATGLNLGGSLLAFGYDWMKIHPDPNTKVNPNG